ncbi:MAG: ATP-dependent DNA helicase DinG [Treponema sp. RIFOXYC1_FULL_61_9]|nr:MAG: ATP-dependent DNA helicase DinG [Treponema sp. GWC1_61_84]OHE70946.1 MAG: ATP-dependent DNA helicase DinG [Treponema sp. RIFOXYC1_FULL_61_9]
MRSDRRLGEGAIAAMKAEIDTVEGAEVFAIGFLGEGGLVERLEFVARGHDSAVPAPSALLEKGDVLLHNHPSGSLTPSDADLSIASRAAEAGVGSFIVDNEVERVYVVVEPVLRRLKTPLDADRLIATMKAGGALARRLDHYEPRESQLALMRRTVDAFNNDGILAAEAGTGVGKSFAYLLPALAWAATNDERVVISTATINLQQQLFEKDIPFVLSAMKKQVKAVLMKGRNNYLCLRRLADAGREADLFQDDMEAFSAIMAWAETTGTGVKSDLPFMVDEGLWSRVCSESDTCLGPRCLDREHCFFLKLRREASDARIIVANHHLLFADLAARKEGAGYDGTVVLPPYERIIVDEAHTIDAAATSFFSSDFGRLSAFRQLGRLYRRKRGLETGLVPKLATLARNEAATDEVSDALDGLRKSLEALDAAGLLLAGTQGTFRLSGTKDPSLDSVLFDKLAETRNRVSIIAGMVRKLIDSLDEADADDTSVWEAKAILRRLESAGSVCGRFLEYDERPGEVCWIERNRTSKGDQWARFSATPLEVAPALREALFEPNRTVCCVSATLTVADSFSYWIRRSGADDGRGAAFVTDRFPSPFPYSRSVLLAAPVDAPLPDESSYRSFIDAAVTRLVVAAGGSSLVLFTSYDAMRSAYAAAQGALADAGIRCMKQGDDDRARLLKAFIEDEKSALFATDSFWEGVDAPGDTLRLVILCRLPFRSPNEPVFEARREALESRGGNAFMELSLPEAVMKFKQGFGRLMRRSSDGGAVVVLDGRLLRKKYGAVFIRSLPETRTSFADFETVVDEVRSFLSR